MSARLSSTRGIGIENLGVIRSRSGLAAVHGSVVGAALHTSLCTALCTVLCTALCIVLSACAPEAPEELPAWAAPLEEENLAPEPSSEDGARHPEAIATAYGDTGSYLWAHGRAYLHAPLDEVAEALRDPDVCVDRREVTRWTVEHDVVDDAPISFRVHHVVENVVTVEFTTLWRQGSVGDDPTVYARAIKTEGTEFIAHLEDSVVLRPVEDDVTAIELMRHREAMMGGPADTATYLEDLFESLKARVHGRPLPTYP